jgi:uncharacterized protein YerC
MEFPLENPNSRSRRQPENNHFALTSSFGTLPHKTLIIFPLKFYLYKADSFYMTNDEIQALIRQRNQEIPMECANKVKAMREQLKVAKMIEGGSAYWDHSNMICPKCGGDYTHITHVYTRLGSDKLEASIYHGTKQHGTTEERRSALVVEFGCEGGCAFEIVIQQHKGINFVTVNGGKT